MSEPQILSDKEVGLFIDLGDPFAAVAVGDWLATDAGARYLVVASHHVTSRGHAQRNRWRMRAVRLQRGCDVPTDVICWWVYWYDRNRKRNR